MTPPKGAKMRQKAGTQTASAEQVVKDIRRATRKQYGAEEKIRIVLVMLDLWTLVELVTSKGSRRPKQQQQDDSPNNTPSNPCDVRVGCLPFQNFLMNDHRNTPHELFIGGEQNQIDPNQLRWTFQHLPKMGDFVECVAAD